MPTPPTHDEKATDVQSGNADDGGLSGLLLRLVSQGLAWMTGIGALLLASFWVADIAVWLKIPYCVREWSEWVLSVETVVLDDMLRPFVGPILDRPLAVALPILLLVGTGYLSGWCGVKATEMRQR